MGVLFHAKDVADKRLVNEIKNQKVKFELMQMELINGGNNEEFVFFVARNDLDLTKRAIKIKLAMHKTQRQEQHKIMQIKSNLVIPNARHHKLTQINQLMHQKQAHLRC